jgi:hypothetical protein
MTTLIIIVSSIITIFLVGFMFYSLKMSNRKKETSDWKVGDHIRLFNQNGLVKLLGWSENAIYVEIEGAANKIEWDEFNFNKSVIWRRNWNDCGKYMGNQKPGFTPVLVPVAQLSVDGKPVETLSEIECEIYLKKALEEEAYELADAIRKRSEKFR